MSQIPAMDDQPAASDTPPAAVVSHLPPSGMIIETVRNRLEEVDVALGAVAADLGVPIVEDADVTPVPPSLRTRLLTRLGPVGEHVEMAVRRRWAPPLTDVLSRARSNIRNTLAFADAALEGRQAWRTPMPLAAAYALLDIDQELLTAFEISMESLLDASNHRAVDRAAAYQSLLVTGQRTFAHAENLESTLMQWNTLALPDRTGMVTVTVPRRVAGRRPT